MKVMGIDNGFSGGLVTVESQFVGIGVVNKVVMPVVDRPDGKSELNIDYLVTYIAKVHPDVVFLEKAQSMPKQGVSGVFRYGEGYGIIKGIVRTLGIRLELVPPQTWQKVMFKGLPKTGTKELSHRVCKKLWPEESWVATTRSRKFHTGMVDAAMIACFGLNYILGGTEFTTKVKGKGKK
jgi:crossover junction endodeoxyribonuclease RuvC